ncbi:multisubunit potassium/proton antiporter PhaC subunit [Aliiruegeria haliotis]|uniref:Multisubunit potassium/proton antiporter PhaC subunit n=1 Tax=Aliiruegeria haliotis TaxID=1280846 RepID=A0A2T0RVT5_9RHOB|nr:Na+/H+ antiporter subunit C [Aliiruegeria haliotis]PRY25305.1 multisubunit potassium/proton antiporter PhaC subunit [Aliiruegeria haliotis]
MELLMAILIGLQTAGGLYLVMRRRTFSVIVGTALMTYAVNLFLFASGRLAFNMPPIYSKYAEGYTDPLPQALVLTAIVISFGMTAVAVMIALGAYLESDTDHIDMRRDPMDLDPDEIAPEDDDFYMPGLQRPKGDHG